MNESTSNQNIDIKPQLVASFAKNKRETVRISFTEWGGEHYLDLRVFLLSRKGEWIRTRKGLMVNADLIPDLAAAIEKAGAEMSLVNNE